MDFISDSFRTALWLLLSFDPEVYGIISVSVKVSCSAIFLAAAIGLPVGVLLATREFPLRRTMVLLTNTFMGLPTVFVGLLVLSFLSRKGPLGGLGLLFTPAAMVMGQLILAFPIIAGVSYASLASLDPRISLSSRTLGASPFREVLTLLVEGRLGVVSAILAAFGRVFTEVGASLMLGGNIRFYTRNIPTAIALETGKGEFALALALGIVLLAIALLVNFLVHLLSVRLREGEY